jgi:hypothetical protein
MKKTIALPLCVCVSLFACSSAFAQTSQPVDVTEVTKVIEEFWTALGTFDAEAMKQTFDWPVTIVEASSKTTKNPRVLMLPKDLDKDFGGPLPKSGHSEFYGTKLTEFNVQMQNPTLALVTYTATLPATTDAHKEGSFNAIAIVRKSPLWEHSWKIIFITVPK